MCKNEEEFLRNYDSSKYEKLSITTDILLVSISNEKTTDYRRNDQKK